MLSYHLLTRILMPDALSEESALADAVSSALTGFLPHDTYVAMASKDGARTISPAARERRMSTLLQNDCNPLLDLVLSCDTELHFAARWNSINAELPLGVVTQVSLEGDRVTRTCRSGHDSALRESVIELLLEQLRALRSKPDLTSQPALRRIARDLRPAGDIVTEIIDCLFEAPGAGLPECVTELGCSRRTLQRGLNVAGVTFVSLRSAVRLSLSKEQLLDTSESMTAVALAGGFYDAAHFCHAFREACGISPSKYRALSRQPAPSEPRRPSVAREAGMPT